MVSVMGCFRYSSPSSSRSSASARSPPSSPLVAPPPPPPAGLSFAHRSSRPGFGRPKLAQVMSSNDPVVSRAIENVWPQELVQGRYVEEGRISHYLTRDVVTADRVEIEEQYLSRGQSIGPMNHKADRGTIGLFIRPCEEKDKDDVQFLTCAHITYRFEEPDGLAEVLQG